MQADVQTAYLLAKLGGPPTWIRLPRWALPPAARDMKDPVLKLSRALYGHPRSGGDWDQHLGRILKGRGWTPVEGVLSLWISPCRKCALAVYVDDLLCGGPKESVLKHLTEINRFIKLAAIEKLDTFLGTKYVIERHGDAVTVQISQSDYAGLLIERYMAARSISGTLKCLPTPMVDSPVLAEASTSPAPTHVLADLGGLLFLSRSSRPDLAYAVGFLGRYSHAWSKEMDLKLHRVFQYMQATRGRSLVWHILPDTLPTIEIYVDADHAGCPDTSRSTTGWVIFTKQKESYSLLDWSSRRQQAVSRSTAEAEIVAGGDCLQYATGYHDVLERLFHAALPVQMWTDYEAARLAYTNGYSRKLRHMRKHQRVSAAFVKEGLDKLKAPVGRIDSACNTADMFTKPLPRGTFEDHVTSLGLHDVS